MQIFRFLRPAKAWLFLAATALPWAGPAWADSYQPIAVSGFNANVVISADGSNAGALTDLDLSHNVLFVSGFKGSTHGLPANGTVNSQTLAGATYQLAPYGNGNTALLLQTGHQSGSLALAQSGAYAKLAILATSAEAASGFQATLYFSDGSSQAYPFNVPDWCGSGGSIAIDGLYRYVRGAASVDASHACQIFDNLITLNAADSLKLLTRIDFQQTTNNTAHTAIFALTGVAPAGVPTAPVTTAATGIAPTGFTAQWNSAAGATSYVLDVATDSGFTHLVAGYNNLNVGAATSLPITALAPATTYYYRVRGVNAAGQSLSSNVTLATTASLPPPAQGAASVPALGPAGLALLAVLLPFAGLGARRRQSRRTASAEKA